jgi:mannitol 2-dehydrogenase
VPGIDLSDYKATLIQRFSNQKIADQLQRVCSDGSSKFPKFTVPTIDRLIADGKPLDRAALVVAAWALYLQQPADVRAYTIVDPRADFCRELVSDDAKLTERLLGVEEIFGKTIAQSTEFAAAFERQLRNLRTLGVQGTLHALRGNGR